MMSKNDTRPPKNAVTVVKTPPVESVIVVDTFCRKSADEKVSVTEPHGRSPCVESEILRFERVSGSCFKNVEASFRSGGIKKNSTEKNTPITSAYIQITASNLLNPCRDKNLTAGSMAEAITTAASTTSTMSRKNQSKNASTKNNKTVTIVPGVIVTLRGRSDITAS